MKNSWLIDITPHQWDLETPVSMAGIGTAVERLEAYKTKLGNLREDMMTDEILCSKDKEVIGSNIGKLF